MKSYVEQARKNIELEEGKGVIEQLLLECYLSPGISTKALARRTLLPTPITAAMKRELIKVGALVQDRGVRCTQDGAAWIEQEWGYEGMNRSLFKQLLHETAWKEATKHVLATLESLFSQRPEVNVQIDQSKCTAETSLRRAILCLKHHALIGKKIVCVGDDDLVSVSIGLLLQQLFPKGHHTTKVHVMDIDERFLQFIEQVAAQRGLPIQCHSLDLRNSLPHSLHRQFDTVFTDPPYTLDGMSLFLSRGIQALQKEKGIPIFLSFAHKSPEFMLAMQHKFVRMGLTVSANYPRFNAYEGAEMIANRSQMFILRTTDQTEAEYTGLFTDAIYTGEVKQSLRTYRCKQCASEVHVGVQGDIATIEQLKHKGCAHCGQHTFEMIAKR
ncbi:bis-aminopropyl spermidine synthase family protein [Longirhabdus pacifica]|uniref:bis-aminopropyl spermidine synthase family protein n=1 Tax=Longirhabdus pacifica TaxID=2305227 RepID=UPI0010092C63|nr:bis-aminopropyl spermidine synthase family protein [Longirhabdus pacifica]